MEVGEASARVMLLPDSTGLSPINFRGDDAEEGIRGDELLTRNETYIGRCTDSYQ